MPHWRFLTFIYRCFFLILLTTNSIGTIVNITDGLIYMSIIFNFLFFDALITYGWCPSVKLLPMDFTDFFIDFFLIFSSISSLFLWPKHRHCGKDLVGRSRGSGAVQSKQCSHLARTLPILMSFGPTQAILTVIVLCFNPFVVFFFHPLHSVFVLGKHHRSLSCVCSQDWVKS